MSDRWLIDHKTKIWVIVIDVNVSDAWQYYIYAGPIISWLVYLGH